MPSLRLVIQLLYTSPPSLRCLWTTAFCCKQRFPHQTRYRCLHSIDPCSPLYLSFNSICFQHICFTKTQPPKQYTSVLKPTLCLWIFAPLMEMHSVTPRTNNNVDDVKSWVDIYCFLARYPYNIITTTVDFYSVLFENVKKHGNYKNKKSDCNLSCWLPGKVPKSEAELWAWFSQYGSTTITAGTSGFSSSISTIPTRYLKPSFYSYCWWPYKLATDSTDVFFKVGLSKVKQIST